MKTSEIREAFLQFFVENGHKTVASSSLVPVEDPSLLFTNAGMVQFKDVFLGSNDLGINRAVSSQRCVRAGGKHNDLDNVGYTARHHTFFEMLGNFSFGDYFKRDAIQFGWLFLTERLGIPSDKLWVTVYEDDLEAEKIWLEEIGISPDNFSRCGEKDNFWMMGDTGPCGPCSEIFYDHGPDIPGGPPGSPDEDGDRYVEIWNLVFMQYERSADGDLKPIPAPSVDTGMGLERIAAVMQGVHNNYDIDLFKNLIRDIREHCPAAKPELASLRVIADHIRSSVFLCADGVIPSNEGRGYVLRRIIRRALRHGHKLNINELFFHKLVGSLVKEMGSAYPLLNKKQSMITEMLRLEEERFATTLEQGMHILESAISSLTGDVLNGATIFKLYDTYGFPYDLTADIARERGLTLDVAGFEEAMDAQRMRAREGSQFSASGGDTELALESLNKIGDSQDFLGYETNVARSEIKGLFIETAPVNILEASEQGVVILDSTPFYAESGGQVGDTGLIVVKDAIFSVAETRKRGGLFLHYGVMETGSLSVGDMVEASIDINRRQAIRLNHSATHLLHAALRQLLGKHVEQKGSLVDENKLRFDFSHGQGLDGASVRDVEVLVNEKIRGNFEISSNVMAYDAAIESGAVALFGEKYGDEVRVLSMSEFSTELCGGTHASRTGDIGVFKIVSESGVASGVRRIEAVTGDIAIEHLTQLDRRISQLSTLLKSNESDLEQKVEQIISRNRSLEKETQELKHKLSGKSGQDLKENAVTVNEVTVVSEILDDADIDALRVACDDLKSRFTDAVIVLGSVEGDNIKLIAGVSKSLTKVLKAGELVNFVAEQVGGKGGGRHDMAQAGGTNIEKLPEALSSVLAWVENKTT